MLKLKSRGAELRGPHSWEYNHTDVYESDTPITEEDVQKLIEDRYNSFPVVRTRHRIEGNELHITVIEDNCA